MNKGFLGYLGKLNKKEGKKEPKIIFYLKIE
jgi:hypothetical protein